MSLSSELCLWNRQWSLSFYLKPIPRDMKMIIAEASQVLQKEYMTEKNCWKEQKTLLLVHSCRHCHFKKDGNRHRNRSRKSKWSRYYSIDILRFRTTSSPSPPFLFLNTYMWLTITLIIGTSVLFLELLKFLKTYKSCFYNYTLLHIKRLYLEATEIELDFCFEFFAF